MILRSCLPADVIGGPASRENNCSDDSTSSEREFQKSKIIKDKKK